MLLASCQTQESPFDGLLSGAAARPNIIYLHTHDSGRFWGPYTPAIEMPNLQRFAAQGVKFTQAFCASPTCSPSRASLLTGMTPGCNGMWGLAHRGWELNNYAQTLPSFLKRSGYTTALVGLQHIADGDPYAAAKKIGYGVYKKPATKLAKNVADTAVQYLKSRPRAPFFLDIGFMETHIINRNVDARFGYGAGDPAQAYLPPTLEDISETRRDMASFEIAAQQFDTALGRILKALSDTGLAKNTLVIITTDHGAPLPTMKARHTDMGLGVSLLLRGPGGFTGGKTYNALVSHLDIFPTITSLLGLTRPAWLQGNSLLPIVKGSKTEVNNAVYAEYQDHSVTEPQASVRTKTHKYIRRLDGSTQYRAENVDPSLTGDLWRSDGRASGPVDAEQLFDLRTDPKERTNLAADPAYANTLQEMRNLMVARMQKYNNPLLYKYGVSQGPPT